MIHIQYLTFTKTKDDTKFFKAGIAVTTITDLRLNEWQPFSLALEDWYQDYVGLLYGGPLGGVVYNPNEWQP